MIRARARALVVTNSTCGIEGIACGCPVIIPRLVSVVDMNPMSGVSDLPIYVHSVAELREEIEGIMALKESPLPAERCRQFIAEYFKFLDSEEEFLNGLPMIDSVWSGEDDPSA